MKQLTVVIKDHELPIVVNNWVLREYGRGIGENSLQGTLGSLAFLGKYEEGSDNEVPWEDLERLSTIGWLGIKEGCEDASIDCPIREKDVFNAINTVEVASAVIVAIVAGLPRPSEEVEVDESTKKK